MALQRIHLAINTRWILFIKPIEPVKRKGFAKLVMRLFRDI
ncbi:hypothetical protein HMPREF1574_00802 [Gardnerella pickettii JCP7659]|uniref:Uncharacterized protein n=2 Tax=Gardnerella TaxID=2701 RepID=S4GVN9_9BIFI|nr:hypothetical protein HMPREF1581_00349 [Gardnerella vaginalis JCP8108]EPI50887.1 hypothetical protein HMPREF1576_00616 [Gardnerella pickettii JCP7719]EPI55055.1 hypothetical protein HMPREF1574_00802 [Gardnerella pickettii JCP7659]KXA16668.1 hypothetical protein HMPREF3204_00456 [Gardnerella pickettii]